MAQNLAPILEYWFTALNSSVGIVVNSSDRHTLMNKLYEARRTYSNPAELEGLSITMSPTNDQELWIVHKKVKVNGPA